MGCASSSPMVQTTGSEMLKAATHVASDATKTAEDAVEGNNNNVIIVVITHTYIHTFTLTFIHSQNHAPLHLPSFVV